MTRAASGRSLRRIALGVGGLLLVVATFVYFLPKIADYRDVWDVLQDVPWPWAVALLVVAAINILTFAPPWQVALPGLSFVRALQVTQASTALSMSSLPASPRAWPDRSQCCAGRVSRPARSRAR